MIKTRFAPSPTGLVHLGNIRTALFNALLAYHNQGIFLLRIEDTDQERSEQRYVEQLMADLRWLGLDWQEGNIETGSGQGQYAPYAQSQRGDIYNHYYQQLEQSGLVYPCFCSPEELSISRKLQRSAGQAPRYTGTCSHLQADEVANKLAQGLKPTLRFRVPRGEVIQFDDVVRGLQKFQSDDIGDFIIRRADNTPAFFFCNAVDDALMQVTHVLRGEDHLTNTPRQLLILNALGLTAPQYGHISLIVGTDNTPLSKRHGSRSIQALAAEGWLPIAINNYLARLGHSGGRNELLPLTELAADFDIKRLGKTPAKYDEDQLLYWQQQAVLHSDEQTLADWLNDTRTLVPEAQYAEFVSAIRGNITFPKDAILWAQILFAQHFAETENWDYSDPAREQIQQAGSAFFQQAVNALETANGAWSELTKVLKKTTDKKGKALFMPLRAALTGQTHGPEMGRLLPLLGQQEASLRLQRAADMSG
ncbi:glutamate--tRNA ligase [Candidatus Venteria ishoeyi]|uniref:Glutamate--tRNA ligase n=1 Tax=Candidatus Venteria ishoeyi TaxID=1899563 RepID=A0A1H6F8Q8_9GAMM|nr:glutamate--tRNA ligase [Candidatus Venteria ishoeyi]MDM8547326.1 glutamate--tRNA ligase [Candidatus Venteria ishoeyi]SEH05781.1 Glutamate--tRNA ligase 1 [Candidatus Venteria ishoeyi]SEH07391.1 Glutamate--tRNA ligase 1 [Candidatus Venteria ishoeyi]